MIGYIYSKIFKKIRGASIKNSKIHSSSKVEAGSSFINSNMDKHSFCGYDCDINNAEIGAFCSIANGVIIGGGAHPIDWASTSPVFYSGRDSVKKKFSEFNRSKPLKSYIGSDVWIGQNCIIKQGINIGHGAVIGMGSIVTKDVKPYEIVAGNPAKLIRYRFNESICEKLNASKWWELEEQVLEKIAIKIRDPEIFLKLLDEIKIDKNL